MITPAALQSMLADTPYGALLNVDPQGLQLPNFIAVAHGQKPAMDTWVRVEHLASFRSAMDALGLVHAVDTLIDRADRGLARVAQERLGSTRAALRRSPAPGVEAHVFVAADPAALDRARASGWYPLLVDGTFIEKPLFDHDRFGVALGYPPCCRAFFLERNDWRRDNSWCAAALRAAKGSAGLAEGSWQANGLLRHTAAGLVAHIPCSPACERTTEQAAHLYSAIQALSGSYATSMREELTGVFLVLSEAMVYRLEGAILEDGSCRYAGVTVINPTVPAGPLFELLKAGDRCSLEEGFILVEHDDRPAGAFQARGDQHAPECPVLIDYH